jgi:hypothetical protein
MDSRLKKQIIAVSVVMVCLILATVLAVNYIQSAAKARRAAESEALDEAQEADEDVGDQTLAQRYQLDPDRDPYAFLADDDFFDPVLETVDPGTVLSMLVSSVEKDMRVNVVDGNGTRITGQSLVVEVTDSAGSTRKYRDADQDGTIYIAPVEPGDYELSLEPVDGYVMADESTPLTVKEQIEYVVIDDISYSIKSVDEIDEAAEDTAINEAELNADGTESNRRLEQRD